MAAEPHHGGDRAAGAVTSLDGIAVVVFWGGFGILVYVYGGYLLVLRLLVPVRGRARTGDRGTTAGPPSVTVLLTVHDAEREIGARLDDLLGQDFDAARFDIVVASDGSTDGTAAIVRHYAARARVTLVEAARAGKSAAQNAALARVSGDIVVLTDVQARFAPDFLSEIAWLFDDPEVGCVTAALEFRPAEGGLARGQSLHWRQELAMREAESRLGILAVASGQAMAIRRRLFEPIPEHVGEDCVLPLMVVRRGLRVVHGAQARAWDEVRADSGDELRARARMVLRNWQGTWLFPELLNPLRRPGIAWSLWSHKLLKWLGPVWIVLATGAGLWLARYPPYLALMGVLAVACAAGAMGFIGDRAGRRRGVASLVFSFGLANLGFLLGLWHVVQGRRIVAYAGSRPRPE
jgi:cellulose synthase/poly-beta-1,6-N-acetylglucosamine synthase-like glycosyltransferase